jgi:hypothetical protein
MLEETESKYELVKRLKKNAQKFSSKIWKDDFTQLTFFDCECDRKKDGEPLELRGIEK